MKLTQFRKLIREEVRKVVSESKLESATLTMFNVAQKYKTPGGGGAGQMPYTKFLELVKTGGIKSVISGTAKTIDIQLYDHKADQSLTPYFKKMQQDLFALGYKWIDGTQEIERAGGRGGNLFLGVNPQAKTMDVFRD